MSRGLPALWPDALQRLKSRSSYQWISPFTLYQARCVRAFFVSGCWTQQEFRLRSRHDEVVGPLPWRWVARSVGVNFVEVRHPRRGRATATATVVNATDANAWFRG